jgi:hypothetical protein
MNKWCKNQNKTKDRVYWQKRKKNYVSQWLLFFSKYRQSNDWYIRKSSTSACIYLYINSIIQFSEVTFRVQIRTEKWHSRNIFEFITEDNSDHLMRPSSTGRNASWHAQTKSNPSCLAKEQEEVVFLFYWIECIYWVRLCVSSGKVKILTACS